MHFHLSSFISWSGLSDQIDIRLESVSEGIYTWSFQDRIAIQSEKTHEVTWCKQPQRDRIQKVNHALKVFDKTHIKGLLDLY